jgi:CheY-specific phosphatase CheX
MSISADEIRRVVHTIWSTQLGLELVDAEAEAIESGLVEQNVVDVAAEYSGDFGGLLVQRCSLQLSLAAAGSAFSASREQLDVSDARDAVVELTNMTAGNLKAVLPGSCEVSMPYLLDKVPSSSPILAQAAFLLQGEPLIVTIYDVE